jgi:hypothetical protein
MDRGGLTRFINNFPVEKRRRSPYRTDIVCRRCTYLNQVRRWVRLSPLVPVGEREGFREHAVWLGPLQ